MNTKMRFKSKRFDYLLKCLLIERSRFSEYLTQFYCNKMYIENLISLLYYYSSYYFFK